MAGLTVGTVPQYYKEVYDVLSSKNSSKVVKEIWLRCFKTSKLPVSILQQIWDECDPSATGSLGRDALYKSMALCALGQQGKGIDEKMLLKYGDTELPQPDLAPPTELRDLAMEIRRATNPTQLGYTYEELKAMDDITLTIMPEKKGMVFKHVEYLLESRELKSSVRRRYKDFEAFNDLMVTKYPYRLVPRMPPKKLTPSPAFIEQRRRALKRYMVLVVRHPVLAKDEIVKVFLTAGGQDVGTKLKEKYKVTADEFVFSTHAKHAQELVSEETRVKYDRVTEQILLMQRIMSSMLQVAHNVENRSLALSQDMKTLASNMSTLATDNLLMSSWTSGNDDTWSYMQRDCETLSEKFGGISECAKQQGVHETSGFTETAHLFLDLIISYQDLCERRERTVHRKHQKALAKVHTMVNYKERMESTGKHLSEKDDSRIIRRDDELIVIEKRNFFSLFCLDLEAQLVHVNLAQLIEIFEQLVASQVRGHVDYLSLWDELKAIVEEMGTRRTKRADLSNASSPNSSLNISSDTSSRHYTPKQSTAASPFV